MGAGDLQTVSVWMGNLSKALQSLSFLTAKRVEMAAAEQISYIGSGSPAQLCALYQSCNRYFFEVFKIQNTKYF